MDGGSESVLILVVEKDPHVRELERFFLEEAGYVVVFCDDGEQALHRARTTLPTMLISEILVPKLDGLRVCRALKEDPTTRHIIVLIFSILAAEERALGAGANAFMRKPVNDVLLIDAVKTLLAKHLEQGRR